ncbi:MAG: hypothetical protein SGILL_007917 [Bacillariaceae sp.]
MRVGEKFSKVGKQLGDRISTLGSSISKKDATRTLDWQGQKSSQLFEDIPESTTLSASSLGQASIAGRQERSSTSLRQNDLRQRSSVTEMSTATDTTASLDGAIAEAEESRPTCLMMDEGDLSPATIYTRVSLQNENHPFFKRTWTLRHKVDLSSPLLDRNAYGIIQQFHANGGTGWPPQLNAYEKLRESVKFQDISVTLTGTDHVTGNVVFGNTSYTASDLVIGYRFANTLVKSKATGEIGVDLSLLNDVLEQHGSGAEPLIEEAKFHPPLTMVDVIADIENQIPELAE